MLESFANPPAEYRLAPFWFWNAELEESEIERQIREMHAKGVGGFFIHGRFGLRTEYMGEQWLSLVERACELAREMGMLVYLYDDSAFPSGVAGGETMRDPKHFSKFLDVSRQSVRSNETIETTLPEGELLSAVAVNTDAERVVTDITESVRDGVLTWTSPAQGRYEVLAFVAAVARSASFIHGAEPDYFELSLVDTFFAHTHERYAERLKPYFGSVIKGIFTDEPKIQSIHHIHEDANTTAWFADILERFEADHGYDLKANLACLATDAGPNTCKVRRDFWATVTNHYIERYFRRYRQWCEANGIQFTGHLFLEEGIYANTVYQGNFPLVLSEFHVPGVDHMGLSAENEYTIANSPMSLTRTHANKLVSSTAHLNKAPRVLSETFGCCGWSLSMKHMKWITDWQFSLGVNLLCPHAFYYSISGVRKTDAPPSQFYQATYWPHYQLYADYVARLSYALSQGTHVAQVALLYPIKGFQSEWAIGSQGRVDRMIAEYFDTYCAHLLKEHIDYDILGEESIKAASCVDQQLIVSGESYEMLIMPPTTAIGYDTAVKIDEFVRDGGKLLGTALLPVEDADGDRHEEVREIFSRLFGRDPVSMREIARHSFPTRGHALTHVSDNVLFFESAQPSDLTPVLRAHVSAAIKPEVSARWRGRECPDVTCLHRKLEDAEVYFFSNNCDQAREVHLSIRCEMAPYMLDPETGKSVALPNCTQQGGRTVLLHRFEAYGSLLVYFGIEPALAVAPPSSGIEGENVQTAKDWAFSTEQPNCLPLGSWKLDIATHQDRMTYEYAAEFAVDEVPEELLLVLDDMPTVGGIAERAGSECRVTVNGLPAEEMRPWVVDINFQSIDISPLIQEGTNEVRVIVDHGGWSGDPQLMLAEARLMGSFSLDETSTRLLAPRQSISEGSWADQGYPYYSGTAVYTQGVRMPVLGRNQRAFLFADDVADMMECYVNGEPAGLRAWPPFGVDITSLVEPGPNIIEIKVTNSLANMLLSERRPSGLVEGARIIVA